MHGNLRARRAFPALIAASALMALAGCASAPGGTTASTRTTAPTRTTASPRSTGPGGTPAGLPLAPARRQPDQVMLRLTDAHAREILPRAADGREPGPGSGPWPPRSAGSRGSRPGSIARALYRARSCCSSPSRATRTPGCSSMTQAAPASPGSGPPGSGHGRHGRAGCWARRSAGRAGLHPGHLSEQRAAAVTRPGGRTRSGTDRDGSLRSRRGPCRTLPVLEPPSGPGRGSACRRC